MIYFTEFGDNPITISVESVLMAGQRLRRWPTLKSRVLFFKWVTFSIPVEKLNMTLYADITHITQSNNC